MAFLILTLIRMQRLKSDVVLPKETFIVAQLFE
jgi:hypothetical protein